MQKMKIVETVSELNLSLQAARQAGRSIGLVPTMGALHEGHASLVSRSVKENDITVVSVFVNPTQFNDKTDLANYPRTLEADCQLLEKLGADIVFAPSVEEIYPEPDTRTFSYPPIDTVMEGAPPPRSFQRRMSDCQQIIHVRTARQGILRRKGLSANCRHPRHGGRPQTAR